MTIGCFGCDERSHIAYLDGKNIHIRTHASQRKFSLTTWASIAVNCLLGPYILPERFYGYIHLTFFQNRFQHNDGNSRILAGKSGHICRLLFLDAGLITVDQSHGHHDHQICLQLIFSLWVFSNGIYETLVSSL